MVYVIKADGSKQDFDRNKIIRTCLRMHASEEAAKEVADVVEKRVYEGIATKKILQMIFKYMKKYRPEVKHSIDLRESISLLRPMPDFEEFVRLILNEYGYEITKNQIIEGRCVEHEIDGIAKKGQEVLMLEMKHHIKHHTYTGLGICLEAQARFEDINAGFASKHTIRFSGVLIVCNTKFSEHAKRYASCKGIRLLGWNTPVDNGLEKIVEQKRLYPVTMIKNLDRKAEMRLGDAGILLLKDVKRMDVDELRRKTKLPMNRIKTFKKKAEQLLG